MNECHPATCRDELIWRAEIERLTRERDEARKALRWMREYIEASPFEGRPRIAALIKIDAALEKAHD